MGRVFFGLILTAIIYLGSTVFNWQQAVTHEATHDH